ncbi:hypothetical protein XELAEV_18033128mg [Xenopus laevis]|uniref:Uncharacterized protein n=1 Tax=Xenopus laevis TaxID=8355 RepID=A0A974CJS7_XENLA|nr:hypothetical protein XELAEV_18033128mg [Xenopus laevis]
MSQGSNPFHSIVQICDCLPLFKQTLFSLLLYSANVSVLCICIIYIYLKCPCYSFPRCCRNLLYSSKATCLSITRSMLLALSNPT